MSNKVSNKRIAKNTVLLYCRMFLTLGVSLYTSRIVLNVLGVNDFGIYNVVGGVVLMFAFLNTSMSSATQRFLTFEIGKNDYKELRRVFSMSLNIHIIIAFVIFILAETIGLWFLNFHLNIPSNRMVAANWVYQFAILAFVINILSVPYNAIIIAHERMNMFAYVSIIEGILKLAVVFTLVWFGYDKLKLYAVLTFIVYGIIWLIYKIYCKQQFSETNYNFIWDKVLYKKLMNYAGWNLFGNIAGVAMGQGVNILINLYFGPAVNAARGISYQINGAVNGFVSNFQVAMNPQIVKNFASGNLNYMHLLIFKGAKYSYFLLLILAIPILLETEIILKWWLKIVPDYAVLFCRLVLINTLIDCISGPLMTGAQATGEIKLYQSVVGGLLFLTLPLSYFFLESGFQPEITLYVSIVISLIALLARLLIIRPLIKISLKKFFKDVIVIVVMVTVISLIAPLFFELQLKQGLARFITVGFVSVIWTTLTIYLIGIDKDERLFLRKKVTFIFGIKRNS